MISERKGTKILRKGIRVFKLQLTMKLNRYENVERVIIVIDKRINKLLIEDKLNPKELLTLIEIRTIHVKEYDGLTRSNNTREMFEKKSK